MKKLFCLLLSFAAISCVSELPEVPQQAAKDDCTVDYYSIISSLGYSTDEIFENDSLFVVSNVVIFRKDDLKEIAADPLTKISTYPTLLTAAQQHISLLVTGTSAADESLLLSAVTEWNAVSNCNILFSYGTEYASETSFTGMYVYISDDPSYLFDTDDPKYSFIQVAPLVIGNHTSGVLAIDTDHPTWTSYSEHNKKWALVHALGLLIGLKPSANEIDSIMYNNLAYPNWSSFSNLDKQDLMTTYPLTVRSFALTSDSSEYYCDTEYIFTPEIDYYKQYQNVVYEYEVQNASSIASHQLIKNQNNSAKITFYSTGTYTITCRIKSGDIVFAETSKTINVAGGFFLPNDENITIGNAFSVRWTCEIGETLDCSVTEHLFDGDATDYSISKISSSEYSVTLKKYGYYTITLTKKDNDGDVIECKEVHIKRFYRPELSFPDFTGTLDHFDYRMNVFEIGFVCPENTQNMTVTSFNPPYNIVAGDGTVLAERLYLVRYDKFYRNAFFPPEPICKGPATDINTAVDMTFDKGMSAVITMPKGRNGYLNTSRGTVNYTGYYAVIIPDDDVYCLNK